ncbi:hypothetical protein Leryth_014120 [Lithospermum erythrorhizon]|nr:hypothetical protein Leryth_014120 [Lithospermum erythrorhizon]
MSKETSSSSSFVPQEDDDVMQLYGSDSGWVEARTYWCQHPEENCVVAAKEVSFVLPLEQAYVGALSAGKSFDLSVWCFSCDAYLDAQVILQLRPAHETAYILKFGEAPPSRAAEVLQLGDNKTDN